MPEFKFDSLPQWAQERLRQQDNQIAQMRQRIEATDPGDSNVFLRGWTVPDQPLGKNQTIVFKVPCSAGAGWPDDEIHVSKEEGGRHIEVRAREGALLIQPNVSNVVRIQIGSF